MTLITPAVKVQALRFSRLFALTFAAQEATLAGPVTRSVLISTAVGAAEVAYRAVWPAAPPVVVIDKPVAAPPVPPVPPADGHVATS